jgi:hypothetical protein
MILWLWWALGGLKWLCVWLAVVFEWSGRVAALAALAGARRRWVRRLKRLA